MKKKPDCFHADPKVAISWVIQDRLLVILIAKAEPIAEDVFGRLMSDLRTYPWNVCLGASLGAVELTSVQRSQLTEVLKGKRIAGLTENAVARGVITALSWFGLQIRAWSWNKTSEAFDYLELPEAQRATALELLQLLREKSS
jgi:hypothetical protein